MLNKLNHWRRKLRKQNNVGRFIVSRLLFKSGLCRFFVIDRGRYRLRFYPTNVSLLYWCKPDCYRDEERVFALCLNEGDTVVDVGANVGGLSLMAASLVGRNGRVYAIEAHPRTFRYLVRNIRLNGFTNVDALNYAITDKEGFVRISDKTADDMNEISEEGSISVRASTLDRILQDQVKTIRLLKIDVEGLERLVLSGAVNVLKITEYVYFESKEQNFQRHGYTTSDVLVLLLASGFTILRVDGSEVCDVPLQHTSTKLENLLAVRNLDEFLKHSHLSYAR